MPYSVNVIFKIVFCPLPKCRKGKLSHDIIYVHEFLALHFWWVGTFSNGSQWIIITSKCFILKIKCEVRDPSLILRQIFPWRRVGSLTWVMLTVGCKLADMDQIKSLWILHENQYMNSILPGQLQILIVLLQCQATGASNRPKFRWMRYGPTLSFRW